MHVSVSECVCESACVSVRDETERGAAERDEAERGWEDRSAAGHRPCALRSFSTNSYVLRYTSMSSLQMRSFDMRRIK